MALQMTLVAFGGALGALARYLAYLLLPAESFPWATLLVNALGCLLAGLLLGKLADSANLQNSFYLFAATGFLGAFTTFSAFAVDSLRLWSTPSLFFLNAGANIFLCLAMAALGRWLLS